MLDRSWIGRVVSRHSAQVETGRLRFFLKVIGEEQVPTDSRAAFPVPLTYLFCLDMERPDPYDWFPGVGLELPRVLHGEQSFRYASPCCAGDTLTFGTTVEDMYERRGGALEFLVKRTRVSAADGRHVADLRSVIVQRHGRAGHAAV
ncbi:MAG: MaoC family dehydratase N-terminal domain-containing protein [Noviherbaspirillum sp.]